MRSYIPITVLFLLVGGVPSLWPCAIAISEPAAAPQGLTLAAVADGTDKISVTLSNQGSEAILFSGYSLQSPLYGLEAQVGERWHDSALGWCGTGVSRQRLAAGASTNFTVHRQGPEGASAHRVTLTYYLDKKGGRGQPAALIVRSPACAVPAAVSATAVAELVEADAASNPQQSPVTFEDPWFPHPALGIVTVTHADGTVTGTADEKTLWAYRASGTIRELQTVSGEARVLVVGDTGTTTVLDAYTGKALSVTQAGSTRVWQRSQGDHVPPSNEAVANDF